MFGLIERGCGGKNVFIVVQNSTNETLIIMILDNASLHCKRIISDNWIKAFLIYLILFTFLKFFSKNTHILEF